VILALTALLDARLKFTGPGGVGIEVQAVAAAANATIEPLEEENDRLRAEIAQARPDLAETVAREDPHVAAARQRWKEVDQRLRADASDWPFAGGGRPDEN
jgi:FtsZ-binding cell division protein ZapB